MCLPRMFWGDVSNLSDSGRRGGNEPCCVVLDEFRGPEPGVERERRKLYGTDVVIGSLGGTKLWMSFGVKGGGSLGGDAFGARL